MGCLCSSGLHREQRCLGPLCGGPAMSGWRPPSAHGSAISKPEPQSGCRVLWPGKLRKSMAFPLSIGTISTEDIIRIRDIYGTGDMGQAIGSSPNGTKASGAVALGHRHAAQGAGRCVISFRVSLGCEAIIPPPPRMPGSMLEYGPFTVEAGAPCSLLAVTQDSLSPSAPVPCCPCHSIATLGVFRNKTLLS